MLSVVKKEQKNPTVGDIIEEEEDEHGDAILEEESTTTEDNYSGEFSSSSEDPFRKTHLDRLFEAGQPIIKAGTINAIVDWLWGCSDKILIQSFLVGYTSYWTSRQLFEFLQNKFSESRTNCSPEGSRDLFKTLDFLATWVDTYYKRDFEAQNMLADLRKFLNEATEAGLSRDVNQIKLLILKRSCRGLATRAFKECDAYLPRQIQTANKKLQKRLSREKTVIPTTRNLTFWDCASIDLAEQLTLQEHEIFRGIKDGELLGLSWMRDKISAQSVCRMVDNFNKITYWVAETILSEPEMKDRVNAIKKFVSIAERCFELNNFHALMEIVAGLSMTAIERLKKTWTLVPSQTKATLEKFNRFMNTKNNFQNYRHTLHRVKDPCVPYIGVYLRDLTFIEEGNPNVYENGLVNFDKLHLNGLQIIDVHKHQEAIYDIKPHPVIQQYLTNMKTKSEDEIFAMLDVLEPSEQLDV
jgi:son of sevenless-like protein